jgi:NAD(P)-dependent dehydrogenase (short-subunit alcohol dehydrogenase family)
MTIASLSTALITGAGREPARSVALALAHAGFRLALNDLTPLRLDETAALVRSSNGQVSVHVGDPSKGMFARGLVEEALEAWGEIDVLVNCPRAEPRQGIFDLDEWDFQRTLEANAVGPFLLTQTVCRYLRAEGKKGVVLNLIGAPLHVPAHPGQEAYFSSQAALRMLTASAAPGLAPYEIRIYGITGAETQAWEIAGHVAALLNVQTAPPSGTVIDLWGAG